MHLKRSVHRAEWIALIFLFLTIGIIGHDPWKWHEPYVFGVIHHFYTHHSWLIPVNADMPFMEKPPLYYWTGTMFCYLLDSVLPLHEAARMASPFYMAIATYFTWKAGQLLFANRQDKQSLGWISVAMLLGEIGLVKDAHMMQTDIALLAGTAITLYALALLEAKPERWKKAGVWLGIGMGVTFLSKGFFIPALLVFSAIAVYASVPALRTRSTWCALGVACVVSAPFIFVWPLLVYLQSPALFMEWFWDNNIGRFLGFSVSKLGVANPSHSMALRILMQALPAWPLSLLYLIHERAHWRKMAYILPASTVVIGLALLTLSASGASNYFIPLYPAFALLAAPALQSLSIRFLRIWNAVAWVSFTLYAAALWGFWFVLLNSQEALLSPWLSKKLGHWYQFGMPAPAQDASIIIAVLATLLWLVSYRLKHSRADATAYMWLSGITLAWVLKMTLLVPWEDAKKSYRPVFANSAQLIYDITGTHSCADMLAYDEDVSPMLEYMMAPGFDTHTPCRFHFVADSSLAIPPGWHLMLTDVRHHNYHPDDNLALYDSGQ